MQGAQGVAFRARAFFIASRPWAAALAQIAAFDPVYSISTTGLPAFSHPSYATHSLYEEALLVDREVERGPQRLQLVRGRS